jgi:uncharacterized protein
MSTLTSPHVLSYAYTRSTGPVVGAFLTALRDRRVVGIRGRDGRVIVPPQEYDPVTSESLDEIVDVGSSGTVVSWSWNPQPRPGQPVPKQRSGSSPGEAVPFAWVLVQLDGADTPLLHALAVDAPGDVQVGMRVRIRWADETVGSIADIACFEPGDGQIRISSDLGAHSDEFESVGAEDAPADATDSNTGAHGDEFESVGAGEHGEPVTMVTTPVQLDYTYTAGPSSEIFLRGTQERKLLGRRCSECAKVYMPPRGVCSMCGAAFTDEIVEVAPTGTVTTFAIVNVNFASREIDLPYAVVEVLFDGAHITSQFLIQGVTHDQVRMGMRVRAVWKDGDLEPTLSNVTHVEPIDEPDRPYESFAEYG